MIDLNNSGFHFILASRSPRRKFLLSETGLNFEVLVIETAENYPENLVCEQIALHVSREKALAFDMYALPANALLIAADTIVWLDGVCIGKPLDEQDARIMLGKLSGKRHTVATGVCLRTRDRMHSFFVNTEVFFRRLEPDEIDYYVKHYKPLDKAGAYGIQEWIGYIGVERIEGSYFNVMGLPVQRLYCELKQFIQNQ
ncbi:Maf family nucleotide pyrophosphatase [Lentimicrobium sp.]|jgi:septum formation protein|uniref:Maf family nucleotide pyrophosphatase n=1 Tax=Lentimicrobium sp. TaxID=2034841 RepID=UPI0025D29031|nr:Maf family nucleotide pyrophosphatase [Lentimicrobium sp.]MCO5255974.1 Maf family nucleotide pyrophosphatase [Lentimicrobium sp.]MCO5263508.1 Maf family nucleotide pyrophosphatase [Lentimicrobium sp.]HPF65798.1 Maf family nucleotide pyrophosphatase [Lentimicrobium sp.]HPJ61771.1 Maf family nucleotide pyrophosphatase [Lentimicrobium sp.]HPR27052.1 Maf family nucleotide pyrophosphatase [Lentimicrobium sp.]